MKRTGLLILALCLLLAACGTVAPEQVSTNATVVSPLPDTTMDNLTDATLSVSLAEGDAYVDDTGKMQMRVKIYSYDRYEAAAVAGIRVGDTLVRHAGEVKVTAVERGEDGNVRINGGAAAGGAELVPGNGGTFFEIGENGTKNWYEAGEATIRVSVDFRGRDNADPAVGEVPIYPGDFLIGAVKNYHFTPENTTIRVAGGQIVELNRSYIPA